MFAKYAKLYSFLTNIVKEWSFKHGTTINFIQRSTKLSRL